ncbi:hypothetical protein QWZ10_22050 [Paracoccus cavernae]|uniref:CMP/dCMP-type deaminase domain-containing protein n=1 Tax=Paracoccus cavernae TaxID=1571207 RepID=A0ABT8DBP2_9RHOB|nr:hypothetical protein [Paracoccus cavernae]
MTNDNDRALMAEALTEAQKGVDSGGMPFGSVLVIDGEIVSRGHNRQIQDNDFWPMPRWSALAIS